MYIVVQFSVSEGPGVMSHFMTKEYDIDWDRTGEA